MLHKLNFKIKITVCLHKILEKWVSKVKLIKKTNKQTNKLNKQHKKTDTLPTQPIFQKDFSEVVYLFLS